MLSGDQRFQAEKLGFHVVIVSDSLGPVDALRFLALVSGEPFDYQKWRKEYFSKYDLDLLLEEAATSQGGKSS